VTAIESIETEVALLLRRAEATRRAVPGAAHRALDRAAYVLLRRLTQDGPANVGTLAADLGLDASTVTRQVTAMEREGYVRRDRDPYDGRGTVISVTATGVTRTKTVRRARADLYEEILTGWSAADRATLATLLHRLNQSMDAHARLQDRTHR
jgi:DNA-binding MarR family transcriptional regulator